MTIFWKIDHLKKPKANKYRAIKCEHPEWGKFDSKSEMQRYGFLLMMKSAGEIISDIERQVFYRLEVNGVKVGQVTVDFRYQLKDGTWVDDDFKGAMVRDIAQRYKTFEAIYGRKIFVARKFNAWHN